MSGPDFVDLSSVVCPGTGVTAREAAVNARVARDQLGGEQVAAAASGLRSRRLALIEDVRVLTGVLALELDDGRSVGDRYDPARRAELVHEATRRSDGFALCAALTLEEIDELPSPGRRCDG